MAEEGGTRRLAAILAADVVGYSRLMSVDEAGTLARMTAHLDDVFKPAIADHQGHVVKATGDGLLAEFASAVEAVACAVQIQTAMAERTGGDPDDRRVTFRIGVNLGDIIFQDGDIFGDGVNVAARLEALADPGGVLISQAVSDQISGKLDAPMEDLGEHTLKNIARPVHLYRMLLDGAEPGRPFANPIKPKPMTSKPWGRTGSMLGAAAVVAAGVVAAVLWRSSPPPAVEPAPAAKIAQSTPAAKPLGKLSVAVLPFLNMSGDPEQEYFSDGMTEDLITDLSKISALIVIARTSSFAFKGKVDDIRNIAKELNVRYVVEGSVRKAGGKVRITTQLIEAATGKHLWAERYDRDFKDIFDLQDEVLGKIVESLKVTLTAKEQRRLARHETDNSQAYDWYLKGLKQESFFSREGNAESRRLFERAIELDPTYAAAHAHLAQAYSLAQENRWTDKREKFAKKALKFAKKAVELDAELPQAHWALGRIVTRPPLGDLDLAIASMKRVIELDPNYADGYASYANTLNYVGRAKEAIPLLKKAMRINPHYPFWYVYVLGQSQYCLTNFEAAIENFKSAVERNPTVAWPHKFLLASYGQLGLQDDADWEISELEALGQPPTIKNARETSPLQDPAYLKLYLDGLRKAGVPEE
ncbi:MAG: adenylate/guanylate cyclase domain-containing protein [Rhodospirillaceae bacterium]|nr:adenylate/guanylate cyclase domain-containing protein [Rhodospirillaceae bacterium]